MTATLALTLALAGGLVVAVQRDLRRAVEGSDRAQAVRTAPVGDYSGQVAPVPDCPICGAQRGAQRFEGDA